MLVSSHREDFECNCCAKEFLNNSKLLDHNKSQHEHAVPLCRNYSNCSCIYSNEDCWFKHTKNSDENETNENKNTEYENIDKEVI